MVVFFVRWLVSSRLAVSAKPASDADALLDQTSYESIQIESN